MERKFPEAFAACGRFARFTACTGEGRPQQGGSPLYFAYGFRPLQEFDIPLPDGVTIASVSMDKPIDP